MRHPFDVCTMGAALWLLTTIVLDKLTPPELSIYMIGAALAPAACITAVFYALRCPPIDFAVLFAAMCLISAVVLEGISPIHPLPDFLILLGFGPALVIGAALNWRRHCDRERLMWPPKGWPRRAGTGRPTQDSR